MYAPLQTTNDVASVATKIAPRVVASCRQSSPVVRHRSSSHPHGGNSPKWPDVARPVHLRCDSREGRQLEHMRQADRWPAAARGRRCASAMSGAVGEGVVVAAVRREQLVVAQDKEFRQAMRSLPIGVLQAGRRASLPLVSLASSSESTYKPHPQTTCELFPSDIPSMCSCSRERMA
ncbi:hypothetical protein BC628DRAFT_821384 [Trametes gibbosa]|nr:hypothetical protein BC628DRAFT_821384 [Trametes gibbosa]